jgi:hypothetical protein
MINIEVFRIHHGALGRDSKPEENATRRCYDRAITGRVCCELMMLIHEL